MTFTGISVPPPNSIVSAWSWPTSKENSKIPMSDHKFHLLQLLPGLQTSCLGSIHLPPAFLLSLGCGRTALGPLGFLISTESPLENTGISLVFSTIPPLQLILNYHLHVVLILTLCCRKNAATSRKCRPENQNSFNLLLKCVLRCVNILHYSFLSSCSKVILPHSQLQCLSHETFF